MKINKYTSYKEIDNQLEILNVERKLAKEKIFLSIENSKESLMPFQEKEAMFGNLFSKIPFAALGKVLIPLALNYFMKRKKG